MHILASAPLSFAAKARAFAAQNIATAERFVIEEARDWPVFWSTIATALWTRARSTLCRRSRVLIIAVVTTRAPATETIVVVILARNRCIEAWRPIQRCFGASRHQQRQCGTQESLTTHGFSWV
jgi:hypothetical protein